MSDNNKNKDYNLEERTAKFGENIIKFCKSIKDNTETKPIKNQLIKSGTSVGANYCEANNASSKRDFRNKIFISKKEAQETKFWLRMSAAVVPEKADEARILWQEAHELTLIFQKICDSVDGKNK
ncbi:four helix bundle protein [Candidatus Falkowbacteria bacterium RIFOXYC2_FULL_47_12]|uniref:Four helix bundle protein n=1 Tax=Candidatus Falkowbacteria bacterium RIFOXYC2_FULL_47_12 TaxID=1798004 RepID=A0A1F5TNZ8_9BACT|nr:MAG: four helix bundle protein [Candidatus Falkowbacteria bacterium RIFOXYC2_FULL_47_12]